MILLFSKSEGPDCFHTFGEALSLRSILLKIGIPARIRRVYGTQYYYVTGYDDLPRAKEELFYDEPEGHAGPD